MRRNQRIFSLWPVLGILLIVMTLIAACDGEKSVERQSPVDITEYTTGGAPDLSFAYTNHAKYLTNTGEFVKVLYEDAGSIELDGQTYQLAEAHTHNPSEHTIDGESFALEMHLVHKRESGEIAVVGILYRLGKPDPAIQSIIDAAPKQGETISPISPMKASDYLPANHGYYAYTGSLTTPPYAEGVEWRVMSEVEEVSEVQVTQLAALTGGGTNNRPIQPLNGRQITAHGPD